jgi:hypothetical protein
VTMAPIVPANAHRSWCGFETYRFEIQRLQLHAVKIGILADTAASSTMPAGTGNALDSHTMLQHSFDVNTRNRYPSNVASLLMTTMTCQSQTHNRTPREQCRV